MDSRDQQWSNFDPVSEWNPAVLSTLLDGKPAIRLHDSKEPFFLLAFKTKYLHVDSGNRATYADHQSHAFSPGDAVAGERIRECV
jgi:hypothetical protein